ncbi:MAG: hypothetical protein ABI571_06520, partial [Actinomycetota bacterium]
METAQIWTVIGLLAATLLGLLALFGGSLNALRSDMHSLTADLRSDMHALNAVLRSDMREVKTDIRSLGEGLRDNTQQLATLT